MPKIYEMTGTKEKAFKPDGSRWPELLGIELELENVANMQNLPYWELKADNSLRNGVEYVFDRPYAGPSVEEALATFYNAKLVFENSARTSTHIHVNVQDMELEAFRTMIVMVYMLEDAIFNVIEAERKWAGYCMPLSEMSNVRLRNVLAAPWPDQSNKVLAAIAPAKNQERYYGLNISAARKYGSLEFRYFPGGPSRTELEEWLDLVVAFKKAANKIGTPVGLIDALNRPEDVVKFLEENFPDYWVRRLLNSVTPDLMLDRFTEISALCTDFAFERRDPMVFVTGPLLKFIGTKIYTGEGLTYLEKLRPVGVITADEWDHHFDKARRLEKGVKEDEEFLTKKGARLNTYAETRPVFERLEEDVAQQAVNRLRELDVRTGARPAPANVPDQAFAIPPAAPRRNYNAEINAHRRDVEAIQREVRRAREHGDDVRATTYNNMANAKRRAIDELLRLQRNEAALRNDF